MNLKELRISKGFSQQNAANFLKMPLRTYKRYETEKSYENTFKYNAIFDSLKKCQKLAKKSDNGKQESIAIFGAGYVGLATKFQLSHYFKNIQLLDKDEKKAKEVGAVTKLKDLNKFQIAIICLPTDFDENTKTFKVDAIVKTIKAIDRMCHNAMIIIKSTVSIGFTESLVKTFGNKIFFMPEFLREKNYLEDVMRPSRIIIGAEKLTPRIMNFAKCLSFCVDIPTKTEFVSTKEAETIKLFSNAYLAMRISYFNELDSFAKKNKLNVKNVIKGVCGDPRIGDYYNKPSFGYSGYCLPKDTKALASIHKSKLFDGVISSNEERFESIAREIIKEAKAKSKKPIIGFYNLETKKQGSKYRISSMLEILRLVKKYGGICIVFDENYELSEPNFETFIKTSDLIVTNTYDDKLESVKYKVFTRDMLSKK